MTDAQITAGRAWLARRRPDVPRATAADVVTGIRESYPGGWIMFLRLCR